MKLKKIRYASELCISRLEEIAREMDLEFGIEEKKDHKILRFLTSEHSDGIIRLYETKKNGQTLDGTVGNKEISDIVLTIFDERYCQGGDHTIQSKTAIYDINKAKFNEMYNIIESSANKNDYNVNLKDAPSHVNYMIEINHKKKQDKVTVSQFESGKLMIQGRSWEVWDEICNVIDEELNVPTEEMVLRLMSKEGVSVTNVITSDLTSNGETEIKKRLGDAFNFLYDHDKKLIVSSQSMLLSGVDYGDYYCYIAPCLRVIEGYLKKVIADLGFFTETEIEELKLNGKPKFNFGWVFNGNTALQQRIKDQLSGDSAIAAKQEVALLKIYKEYAETRSPLQHDGPPIQKQIDSYDEAESYFDQVVGVISNTYKELYFN